MEVKKYPLPMRIFHWTISFLVLCMLFVGFSMTHWWSKLSFTGQLYLWHKSFGVLILIIVLMRLFTRFSYRKALPVLAQTLPEYEKILANAVHKLLYVFLLIMPLSGYLMSSFSPKSSGVAFFFMPLPQFLPKDQVLAGVFQTVHVYSAYILLGLVSLHLAGVIRHRFFDKPEHDSLRKML